MRRLMVIGMVILVVIWAGFNSANFLLYRQFYTFAQRDLGENLALLCRTVAGSVAPDWIEFLAMGMPELAESRPEEYLRALVDDKRIYAVAVLDTSFAVLFSTDKQLVLNEANPYWASEVGAMRAAALGVPAYGGLRRIGDRYLRVAFAPVMDPLGNAVAIVAIEAGADYFGMLSTLRNGLWFAGGASAVAIIFIAFVLWLGKRELERLQYHLENAATLSGIGMMAATLAHEVKNPLAIIRGSAESIKGAPENEIAELVGFINEEVDRLSGTVESHLAVARNKGFPKTIQKLSSVVDKVVLRYRQQLSQRGIGITIEVEDDPELPYAFSAIRQVLYNLLENSAAATTAGDVIRITLSANWLDGNKYGVIEVADTGKGIPQEQLNSLFEPFRTTKKEGTGLGLFITKRIVEGHGGRISVETEVDKGTTVKIYLPE